MQIVILLAKSNSNFSKIGGHLVVTDVALKKKIKSKANDS
jgi:hypothetical protein